MGFVKHLLEHTKIYESPSSFWKWAGYATLASILRDNVYIKQADKFIYPNIYVLLVADSAIQRKGNPVIFCENLVTSVGNTKVISGRSSIQAILDELSRAETSSKNGNLIKGGSALLSLQELSAGIVNDPEAVGILTDIYDFKEKYTSRLRGTGSFHINNICFTMMAASNEALIGGVYDNKALFGGLLGRTFLVKPNEFRNGKSLFDINDTTESYRKLEAEVLDIAKLRGCYSITKEAIKEYEDWYYPFRESYKTKQDKSGVSGRIHTSVLKLAMLICADERRELWIQRNHIEESIEESISLIPNYSSFVMSGGKSTQADIATIILQAIYNGSPTHETTRKKILQDNWNNFNHEDLEKIIQTLEQAGMIKWKFGNLENTEIVYMMTEKCVQLLFSKGGVT